MFFKKYFLNLIMFFEIIVKHTYLVKFNIYYLITLINFKLNYTYNLKLIV